MKSKRGTAIERKKTLLARSHGWSRNQIGLKEKSCANMRGLELAGEEGASIH